MTARPGHDAIRVAIAGAGLMGRWHAHAARGAGAEVVAVVDPDQARAARLAGRGARALAACEEIGADEAPDVLHVCTPSGTHGPLIALAASRGWHVLVEKPLAGSEEETEKLLALAGEAGVLVCPVHQYAFERSVSVIADRAGRIGRTHMVELAFHTAGAQGLAPAAHPVFAADILPHPLSILQRLPFVTLPAAAEWRVDTLSPASYEMSCRSGAVAIRIVISLAARPTCAVLSVAGDRGMFVADLFHDFVRFRDGAVSRHGKITRPFADALAQFGAASVNIVGRAIRREPAYPGLAALCRAFFGAVRGQGQVPVSAGQAIEVARLRDRFLSGLGAGAGAT